jgi:hypothetical protein
MPRYHFIPFMSHIKLRHNIERQAAVAMDLDIPVDMDHQDVISIADGGGIPQVSLDQVKSFQFPDR